MNFKLSWKIWLLIVFLVLSLISILGVPLTIFKEGVVITSVVPNSSSFEQGLREGQIITEIDGNKIANIGDFVATMKGKFSSDRRVKMVIKTEQAEVILFSTAAPDITVSDIPKTRIKFGLDLAGGSRGLVKAQNVELSSSDSRDLAEIIKNRLNVYGIEDIQVMPISDLSGKNFIRIEIAGITPENLESLISQQGKFEAKIGNETVFVGGKKDITSVARSGQEALIESCPKAEDAYYYCNFRFTLYLSEDAAKRHSQITEKLEANITSNGEKYLSEKLDLFLDDNLVDSLLISEGLKGRVTTQISISGSGTGETEEQAYKNAEDEMNRLQTVLITGSLPYKLEIVKLDNLSPVFGKGIITSILLTGAAAFVAVFAVVFLRYRNLKTSILLLFTSVSEIILIVGIASFIGWNLDLPSIAGILATIGTGIDQQIIILDEAVEGTLSIRQKLKRAFAIILGAYFTGVVALIPLYWAAAGFFKGFAITTIIGITSGILVTRPVFSDMIRLTKE
ncbi:MAG: PDZ domain-containing protein [Nanoarchaeota archaeon]